MDSRRRQTSGGTVLKHVQEAIVKGAKAQGEQMMRLADEVMKVAGQGKELDGRVQGL